MKATVKISKTIQESQYEPYTCEVILEKECTQDREVARLINKAEDFVFNQIESRLESLEK